MEKLSPHMHDYLLVTLAPKLFNLSDEIARKMLIDKHNVAFTLADISYLKNSNPKTTYIVKALHHLNFNQTFIANFLGISQPSVSYHLKKKGYENWESISWEFTLKEKKKWSADVF